MMCLLKSKPCRKITLMNRWNLMSLTVILIEVQIMASRCKQCTSSSWYFSLSYPSFIKLPWLEVAPGDSTCTAMWPCGLNLAILYLPLPSGFLSLLSVLAKWLHTYMCLQSSEHQSSNIVNQTEEGASWIFYLVIIEIPFFSPNASLFLQLQCSMSNILAAFPLKSPPRWERLIIFLSFMRAAWMKVTANFPFNMDTGKNNKY